MKFILLTALIGSVLAIDKPDPNQCLLKKLSSYAKRNSRSRLKNVQVTNDPLLRIISSSSNYNQSVLLQMIKSNFELLPQDLQDQLNNCSTNTDRAMSRCKRLHGSENCSAHNKFAIQIKCPSGYTRHELGRCQRDCEEGTIQIDDFCWKLKTTYLSQTEYPDQASCDQTHLHCRFDKEKNAYMEDCMMNYQRVAFMCVPLCYSDMSAEYIEKVKKDFRYCFVENMYLSTPFFEL